MQNWLGQEITVGDIVYRGAREGDGSSFKVGEVIKVDPAKRTARVAWKLGQGFRAMRRPPEDEAVNSWKRVEHVGSYQDSKWSKVMSSCRLDSKGGPTVDSLVLFDRGRYEELMLKHEQVDRWQRYEIDEYELFRILDNWS